MRRRRPTPNLVRSVLAALVILAAGVPSAPATSAAMEKPFVARLTRELSPGIIFQSGRMRTTGRLIQSVRVASVMSTHPQVRLRAPLSNDKVVGKERPTVLANRKSRPGMTAIVATNGERSIFGRSNAYAAPLSTQISGGELLVAQACARPTLGIDGAGQAMIDEVRVHLSATLPGRPIVKQIQRLNTHRDDSAVVLFTSRFGRSTKTAPGGVEVVLGMERRLRPSDTQTMRVLEVRRGAGNTRLRSGQAVLSVKGDKNRWVRDLRVGQALSLSTAFVRNLAKPCGGEFETLEHWSGVVEAIGGNHFTARRGTVQAPTAAQYPPSVERHPRTGVGVTADGRVLMVTVDGRQPGYSVGVTLAEMGSLMISLGATDAINLDGGGSTVIGKRNRSKGKVVVANRPSDGRERVHSGALIAFAVGS